MRKVRVFLNRKSGLAVSQKPVFKALQKYWDVEGIDLTYQFSKSEADGRAKIKRAIAEGMDTAIVVGGDGMINTMGSELVGTEVKLAVIPTGSGNGFARHFNIPLNVGDACKVLAQGKVMPIDVGTANDRPFFITCSIAWDASLLATYEKSPMRGVLPYFLAAAYELFEYKPQSVRVELDGEEVFFNNPMVFTAANLTQYGGGARIAPKALPDDGHLELVVIVKQDSAKVVPKLIKLFDGTLDQVEEVFSRKFKRLVAYRQKAAPIQLDGELVNSPAEVRFNVIPKALQVIVP